MPPTAVSEFQGLLAGLAADLGTKVDRLAPQVARLGQAERLAFITDAYPALAVPYLSAAADATAVWYDEQPVDLDARPFTAEPAALLPDEQLAASGRWAMLQANPAAALKGTATRSVLAAQRDTVIVNAGREGVRWARHASPTACGFCRMLATRSEEYLYKSSGVVFDKELGAYRTKVIGKRGRTRGKRKLGDRYHDNCHCIAVPVRDNNFQPAPHVAQWEADYRAALKTGATSAKQIALGMEDVAAQRAKAAAGRAIERRDDLAVDLDAADLEAHAIEYWRRVDAEDLHSIPTRDLDSPIPEIVESPMDRAARELDEAIAAGDDARIDKAADALEKIEDAERRAAAKAARAAERKAAKANAQSDEIIRLIDNEGYDPVEAEATVTGKSVESIRRRDFIAQARADGHRGAGFDELLTSVHQRRVDELAIEAENATNGYMVKSKYQLTVSSKSLWQVNDATARKWMSDEMAEWFDQNGRLTRSMLREMALSGRYSMGRFAAQGQDYLQ